MHLSLVPRHNVGENIFLPKQRVPFCEFFQSVFAVRMYTRLSYWIKAKGMESRAFLPCLLVSDAPVGAAAPSPRSLPVVSCPSRVAAASPSPIPFCPHGCPRPPPGPWCRRRRGCSQKWAQLSWRSPRSPFFPAFKNQIWIWIFLFSLL